MLTFPERVGEPGPTFEATGWRGSCGIGGTAIVLRKRGRCTESQDEGSNSYGKAGFHDDARLSRYGLRQISGDQIREYPGPLSHCLPYVDTKKRIIKGGSIIF